MLSFRLDGHNLPHKRPNLAAPNTHYNLNNTNAWGRFTGVVGDFSNFGTAQANVQMSIQSGVLTMNRRELANVALGGAAALAAAKKASATLRPIPPGIKIGMSVNQPSPEYMSYLKQLGVTWVSVAPQQATANAEGFIAQREQWEAGGFKVYNIGSGVGPSGSLHNMPEVTLNLPGRDQKIEEYLNYIRYLGKAGIPYSTYAHMGNGIWSSGRITSARGYSARDGNSKSPDWKGNWAGKVYTEPLSHGRVFTEAGDLGKLHLLHQKGGSGSGGSGCTNRHPSG